MAEYPRAPEGWAVASRRSSGPFATEVTFAHPDGRHAPLVLPAAPQAHLAAVAPPARPRARPLVPAPRLVVDRGPLHRRLGLLPGRAAAVLPRRRRRAGGCPGLLRRVAVLHLRGDAAVAGDDQRRPRTRRGSPRVAAAARLGAAPDRLVEQRRTAGRDGVLQRHDLARAQHGGRRTVVRPGRLETGRLRLDLLPGVRVPRSRRGVRRLAAPPPRSLEGVLVAVNLFGCVAFAVSAVAAYVLPSTGDAVDVTIANAATSVGALAFLVGALLLLPEGAQVGELIYGPHPSRRRLQHGHDAICEVLRDAEAVSTTRSQSPWANTRPLLRPGDSRVAVCARQLRGGPARPAGPDDATRAQGRIMPAPSTARRDRPARRSPRSRPPAAPVAPSRDRVASPATARRTGSRRPRTWPAPPGHPRGRLPPRPR